MKKAVFFDIDGTIWDSKMEIPLSTIEAIHKLRENGHYAFLCSGRSRCAIQPQKLLDIGFDGVLAGCGTFIEYQGEIVYENTIPYQDLMDILEFLKKMDLPVLIEGSQHLYADLEAFGKDNYMAYLKKMLGDDLKPAGSIDRNSKINKMSVVSRGKKEELESALRDRWNVIHHQSVVSEVMPKGFSKSSGIAWICEYLGIDLSNTFAVGDSANDVDMLKFAGHGIAMGNGTPEAKAAADYVTADIHEDGIYKAMEHFGLI